ncbi:MAG: ABC transporter permease, partial [Phycisphaerae bacterium]
MNLIWLIARRDYIETVRTPTFIILLLIVPVLLVAMVSIPALLEKSSGPARMAMVDLPPEWQERLEAMYEAESESEELERKLTLVPMNTPLGVAPDEHAKQLRSQIRVEALYGFVTVEELDDDERTAAVTTRTASRKDGVRWLKRRLPIIVRVDRARQLGVSAEDLARLYAPVEIKPYVLSELGDEARAASRTDRLAAFAPMIFTYVLWLVIFTLGQKLLLSTIEEKSNRTVEIILSSVSPSQFMAGKVLAGVLEGVTVMVVWFATLAAFAGYITQRYLQDLDLMILFARKDHLAFFALYFALGFVLFASLIVGIGSLCNTVKETQNLMMPVSIVMIVPILVMGFVGENPNAPLSIALSYFPFFTPYLMMNRIAATSPPHPLEIVAATTVLLLAIWGTTWAGGRLFRVGVLMYGKPPSLRQMLRLVFTRE